MDHVFVSYSRKDTDFAHLVIENIKKEGFSPWLDKSQIYPGDNWQDEIDQAIKKAFALILIMTPDSVASQYVIYEFGYAVGVRLHIIPLLVQQIDLTDQHPRLIALQHLDFTTSPYPWEDLYAQLHRSRHTRQSNISAIDRIRKRLDDLHVDECKEALDALMQINDPEAYQEILKTATQHPMKDVRAYAMWHLVNLAMPGDKWLIPTMVQALKDPHIPVRREAVRVLGNVGKPAAPILAKLLHSDDPNINTLATTALVAIGPPVIPEILQTTNANDEENYARVARMLMKFSDSSTPYLTEALYDKNPGVSLVAADLLKAKSKRATTEVISLLNDDTTTVRYSVVHILGGNDDPEAVRGLIKSLSDHSADVRQKAIQSLQETGDPIAIPHLVIALSDGEEFVRDAAYSALLSSGEPAIPALVHALSNGDRDTRCDAARLLGRIGAVKATPYLIRAMWDKDPMVLKAALEAFKTLGRPAVAGVVNLLQGDKDERVRIAAAWALGEIGHPDALAPLIKALEDRKSPALRQHVADALGRIGDASAVPALIKICNNDRDRDVQKQAADALKRIGTPEALRVYKDWQAKRQRGTKI